MFSWLHRVTTEQNESLVIELYLILVTLTVTCAKKDSISNSRLFMRPGTVIFCNVAGFLMHDEG